MMELQINITPKKDYLYITVTGDFDPSKGEASLAQAVARARELSITRLLGDLRGMGAYEAGTNILGRYQIAVAIAEHLPRDMKVAFLLSEHQMMSDKFNENVSVNRGAMTMSTTVLNEALEWLGVDTANKQDAGNGL